MKNGSLFSVSFIILSDINFFEENTISGECKIKLNTNSQWKEFDINEDGFQYKVSMQNTNAGALYTTQGYIILKEGDPTLNFLIRNNPYIIIKYTDTIGVSRILGSFDYPLAFTYVMQNGIYKINFQGQHTEPTFTLK